MNKLRKFEKILLCGFGKRGKDIWYPIITNYLKPTIFDILDTKFTQSSEDQNAGIRRFSKMSFIPDGLFYDLIVIAVPPEHHREVSINLSDSGAIIVVETPYGVGDDEKYQLIDYFAEIDAKLALFDNYKFHPTHLMVKRLQSIFGNCVFYGKFNDFVGSHSHNQFVDMFEPNLRISELKLLSDHDEKFIGYTYQAEESNDIYGLEIAGEFKLPQFRPKRPGYQIAFYKRATLICYPYSAITLIQKFRRKFRLNYKLKIGVIITDKGHSDIFLHVQSDWCKISSEHFTIHNDAHEYMKRLRPDPRRSKLWIFSSVINGLKHI